LQAVREQVDATVEEQKITLCNAGVMAFDGKRALQILEKIGHANSKNEYYLTDAVAIARELGLRRLVIETDEDEVRGINTKAQLAAARTGYATTLRRAAPTPASPLLHRNGLSCRGHTLGKDVTIEPFVVFGPGVSVADAQ